MQRFSTCSVVTVHSKHLTAFIAPHPRNLKSGEPPVHHRPSRPHTKPQLTVTAWPCQGTGKLWHWRMISTKCISLPHHHKIKRKHNNSDHPKSGALCGKPGTVWIKSVTVNQGRLWGPDFKQEPSRMGRKGLVKNNTGGALRAEGTVSINGPSPMPLLM